MPMYAIEYTANADRADRVRQYIMYNVQGRSSCCSSAKASSATCSCQHASWQLCCPRKPSHKIRISVTRMSNAKHALDTDHWLYSLHLCRVPACLAFKEV